VDAASDAELVTRCRAGDQAAWDALVDRYARYVHAIVARVYRLDSHDAEDVFQEVFARVFERLDTLRDGDALRPWIAQTARNCAVDSLRRSGREVPVDDVPEVVDDGLARLDEALTVHAALDRLCPSATRSSIASSAATRATARSAPSSSCRPARSRAGSPAASLVSEA